MDERTVTVYILNQQGEKTGFKVKTIAPFQKLVDAYCRGLGVLNNTFGYILDGKRINTARTIQELGLDSDDSDENIIESILHVEGGNADDDENSGDKTLTLKVREAGNGEEIAFKVKKTTQFRKIFKAYAEKKGKARDSLIFLYDGERLNDDHTPKMKEMEENDIIDAMINQQGGSDYESTR